MDDAVTRLSRVLPDVSGAPPRPRRAHAAWLSGHTMLVYGGFMQTVQEIGEGVLDAIDAASALHALDLKTWTWSRVDARPPMRPPRRRRPRRVGGVGAPSLARRRPRGVLLPQRYFCACWWCWFYRSESAAACSAIPRGSGPILGTPGRGATSSLSTERLGRRAARRPVLPTATASWFSSAGRRSQRINDGARDLNDVVVFDVAAPRAPAWRAANRESLQVTGIGGDRDGRLTIERCNRTGAAVETLHTFEWHEMSVSGARATFDKLAADTRGDSWLELRRGPLIELTTQWRVRTPTPAVRNAASLTSVKTVGGEEALVLFGGGVYPDTYYNDTHVLHLEDLPAAAAAPKTAAAGVLCQNAVARR